MDTITKLSGAQLANAGDRLPWLSLFTAAGLTILCFLGAAVGFPLLLEQSNVAAHRIRAASSLQGEVARLDDVLTMSTRMAAQSGDLGWKTVYDRNKPALDRFLTTVRAV